MPCSRLRFGAGERGVPVAVFRDPAALGQALAREILEEIERGHGEGRSYLLGCPAGRSLRSTYSALAALAAARGADLSQLVIAMMDEYLVATPTGHRLCPADTHYSCRGFGRREILDRINDGLPPDRRIPQESLWFPEPELGVGVGLGTIVELSRRVALVMTGTEKRAAASRLRRCADFTSDWPASFIYRCRNPSVLVDQRASPVE